MLEPDRQRGGVKVRLVWGSLILLAVLALWFGFVRSASVRLVAAADAPSAGPLALRALGGDRVDLDSFRGQVVVLSLWASWCPPCRAEVPRLNRLERALGEQGLVVLAVNVEQLAATELSRIMREWEIGYRVVQPGSPFEGAFVWDGTLPYTWLIDREGRVRAHHAGLPVERSLRVACERLLDETIGGQDLSRTSQFHVDVDQVRKPADDAFERRQLVRRDRVRAWVLDPARVDRSPSVNHRVVQVRAGGAARGSDVTDHLILPNLSSAPHALGGGAEVTVDRHVLAAVTNTNRLP
jgi:thiol-disulfide isomerase/thioredoxin